ncbi:MAG: UDP-N-acetylmuramate--L-alanine ligase [Oscillospiraceae bacterium]|jgi:UDP-N-acetylmuramate--alanine ligase|nr:UDP-N-acetylmuramate--L-alanine ligase [Oscillospiraceae bacterium]
MKDFLSGKKKVHFIGCGGSGMLPLEQILLAKGFELSGSDNNDTATFRLAEANGVKVMLGHSAENVNGAELVVYSAAIAESNVELIAARSLNIEVRERSELLGLVSSWYQHALCVCGTHGKTTATSMLTQILLADGADPSAVIGGKLPAVHGYGKSGNGDSIVIEACEFKDTFLRLSPTLSIVLNIDNDHLDYFGNMENLITSFSRFVGMTRDAVLYNGDDVNTVKAVEQSGFAGKRVTFGFADTNDYYATNIEYIAPFETKFTLIGKAECIGDVTIRVPGTHNVLNAVASAAAALLRGTKFSSICEGLNAFNGVGRRFERKGTLNGAVVVDDYAHHPTEVAATLNAAKTMGFKRVIVIHQPFTYSRTNELMNEFAEALSLADKVLLTDIMGGREANAWGVTADMLAAKIVGAEMLGDFVRVADRARELASDGDLIITMGCGDVYKVSDMLIAK